MVDLVKIRKKAKKQVADGGSQVAGEEMPVTPSVSEEPARAVEAEPLSPQSSVLSPEEPASTKLDRFKEEAGRLRGSVESATIESAISTEQLEVLTFVISGEHYAVDIERIVEIVTPRPITRVPNADPSIVGIISLRGTIVTLLDVRLRLRHSQTAETPDTRVVVVDLRGESVGFEVDHVLRVTKLAAGDVEPHPVVHASELDESIRGVFRHGDALTILLDFDKLLGTSASPTWKSPVSTVAPDFAPRSSSR
jgi:purine-binding chemotaxis protein CheW